MNENVAAESAESHNEPESVDPSKRVVRWGDGRTPDPEKICTARRTDGTPCRKQRVTGAVVCATHGGRAPQVKHKARVRLEMAADKLAKQLLQIAIDDDTPAPVKLAAIKDALDRTGLSAKQAVTLEVGPTPEYEALLGEMISGGSRAESRVRRGHGNANAASGWLADELGAIEAEVVDDYEDELSPAPPSSTPPRQALPERQVSSGMLSMEDALDQLHNSSPPPAPQAHRRGRS